MPESQYRATETGREPERSARVRLPSRANALRRSVRRDRLALPKLRRAGDTLCRVTCRIQEPFQVRG